MRTSELAEWTGVGIETLRHYERRRLLEEPTRTPDGCETAHALAEARSRR